MKRFTMIVSAYVFFIKENQILLLKRQNTGYMDGMYSLPAGHIDEGESITNGAIREMKEEVGIPFTPSELEVVHMMHRKSDDIRVDVFFQAKSWSQEPINAEPEKCAELRYFPINQLPDLTIPYIRFAIEAFRKGQIYSEYGWET